MNLHDLLRRYGTIAFLLISAAVVAVFLYFSNRLVNDQATQERARMQIWADATKQIATITSGDVDSESSYIDFLLGILQDNTNIPVLLTDDAGSIINQRNFDLPVKTASPADDPLLIPENRQFLQQKLKTLRAGDNVISIEIRPGVVQHLYYEDSTLLRNLSVYPYIQLVVMVAFVLIVYFAVAASKKAEQNKVWVGLSKETAHQLGTPISSLMAWTELMRETGADPEMVDEMDNDVKRLSTIAARFSKIGSQPQMETADINCVIQSAADYMRGRISSRIDLTVNTSPTPLPVDMSAPLIEWVMENLIKNAVDAMEARGSITINIRSERHMAIVTVTDTGKGMTRKMRKTVFRPGFTTKKRGWGLGLTLARRIIQQYHGGKIFVSDSEPGIGTTFRLQFPIATKPLRT